MTKLRLTVPIHADETAMSFVSRLAARNGVSARTFCIDFGLRFQGAVDGDEETLRHIADLAGADAEALLDSAFVKSGQLQWTYRGHVLHRSVLRRERITICPACALADIQAEPKLRPQSAIYGRVAWLLDPVRTCPVHRTPLVPATGDLTTQWLHDFAHHAGQSLPRLAGLDAVGRRQNPGPLETYAFARLNGRGTSPLLDSMPLAAAVRLCETAGAVLLSGPKVDLKKLPDVDRYIAGGRGYEAIAGGPESFRAFLGRLQGAVGPRARRDGPGAVFGRLLDLLKTTRNGSEFEAPREIAHDYIVENFSLPHGRDLLGKPIQRRPVHSIHTLAKEASVHPKTLRKHLRAAGLVSDAQMTMSDNNVWIDAGRAMEIAQQLSGTLSLAEATKHLCAPRAQMDVLIKAGFVIPQRRMTGFGAQNRYAIADLDVFLAGLETRPPARRTSRLCSIPAAAKSCCCSAAEIVRLIHDGKLRTASSTYFRGYLGIVVNPEAVAKVIRRTEPTGMSLRNAAREIGTSDRVLEALIAEKHVATFTGLNPVNKCPQTLIAFQEIKRFMAMYVSLWTLSKKYGVNGATLKQDLDRAGVKPAFDPLKIWARFYLRRAISGLRLGGR